MDSMFFLPNKPVLALLAFWAFAPLGAHAGELAVLRNGFEQRCDHHAVIDGRLRLFLASGEDNFIEYTPDEVDRFEAAPEEPVSQVHAAVQQEGTALTQADLHQILASAGKAHDLDVDLLASVIKAESGGNARAVSRTGARGLMQLMPGTAAGLGVADSFRPDQNVQGGSTYFDALLTRYHGDLALALAAYNAGPAAVDKYHGIPPYRETRAYVARVIHEFNRRIRAREATERASASTPRKHP
jgi:soluble lytic murein transglycosylase-like protein